MLGGGSDPPQRLHHMLGGRARPPLSTFTTCYGGVSLPESDVRLLHVRVQFVCLCVLSLCKEGAVPYFLIYV